MNLVGTTLGQFQIVQELGKGGMATVYKAYQASLHRHVALKVLSARAGPGHGRGQTLFARGADRGRAAPRQRDHHLRRGQRPGRALYRRRVPGRDHAGPTVGHRRLRAAPQANPAHRAPGLGRARLCPLAGFCPPRHQAQQHHGRSRAQRPRHADGLWPGASDGRKPHHALRLYRGHARLHVARAGQRGRHRSAHGHLFAGRDDLSHAHRQRALCQAHPTRRLVGARDGRAPGHVGGRHRDPARGGGGGAQVDGQRPSRPLRVGQRHGQRPGDGDNGCRYGGARF